MRGIWMLAAVGLMSACASRPPAEVSSEPPGNIRLAEVRISPEQYVGSEVRWGGEITQVDNKANHTEVEVIARELASNARPVSSSRSDGRFIARMAGFADPEVYKPGQLITVTGKLEEPVKRLIGEYDYQFPVVAVKGSYLWNPDADFEPTPYPPSWWYHDPWLRPYPYYHPYYR